MRWPWRRRESDGSEHARETLAAADQHLTEAHEQSRTVAEATRAARHVAKQVDRLTAEVERTLRGRQAT